jgi:hypothetical protein
MAEALSKSPFEPHRLAIGVGGIFILSWVVLTILEPAGTLVENFVNDVTEGYPKLFDQGYGGAAKIAVMTGLIALPAVTAYILVRSEYAKHLHELKLKLSTKSESDTDEPSQETQKVS